MADGDDEPRVRVVGRGHRVHVTVNFGSEEVAHFHCDSSDPSSVEWVLCAVRGAVPTIDEEDLAKVERGILNPEFRDAPVGASVGGAAPELRPILRLIPFAELLKQPPVEWRLDGVLPLSGVAFVFGQPGSGKSFLALDIGLRIAAGLDWCYRKVRQGPVLMLVGEGGAGLGQRAQAWRAGHCEEARRLGIDIDTLPMSVVMEIPPISEPDGQDRIREAIDNMRPKPALVILDTLAQSIPGKDENSVQDVSPALRFLTDLAQTRGLCVLIVHHERKSTEAKGLGAMRGSSAMAAMADTALRVCRSKDAVTVETVKQKDGEADVTIDLRMERADIGKDRDGETRWVPYLRPATESEQVADPDAGLHAFLDRLAAKYATVGVTGRQIENEAEHWGLTRQAIRGHRDAAVARGLLVRTGKGNATKFHLPPSLAVSTEGGDETGKAAQQSAATDATLAAAPPPRGRRDGESSAGAPPPPAEGHEKGSGAEGEGRIYL